MPSANSKRKWFKTEPWVSSPRRRCARRTPTHHRPQLLAPLTTSWRKAPPDLAISSCGEPNSTSLPASSTMILSASRTDESRCAMVSTVAWPNAERTVRWMSACQQVELWVQKKKER